MAGRVAALAGQPLTFIIAVVPIVNMSTAIVTVLMAFVIRNSPSRDAAAMQAKPAKAVDRLRKRY